MPMLAPPLSLSLALCILLGCSGTPASPPAAPPSPAASVATVTPSPGEAGVRAATLKDGWVFGAIQSLRTVVSERQLIYGGREGRASKDYGTGTSYYLTLAGVEYAIHYDDAAKFATLKVGETVNLHPTDSAVCFERATGDDCRRLMNVYRGRRAQAPLGVSH